VVRYRGVRRGGWTRIGGVRGRTWGSKDSVSGVVVGGRRIGRFTYLLYSRNGRGIGFSFLALLALFTGLQEAFGVCYGS
jgi:hypothetical protein